MRYKVSGAIAACWQAKAGVDPPFCRMEEIVFPKNNIDCWKMCPSLAALYASGFPRRAPVFQEAGGYWQDWHII